MAPAARIWLAFACFFRVLFDGAFAARVRDVRLALPAPDADERIEDEPSEDAPAEDTPAEDTPAEDASAEGKGASRRAKRAAAAVPAAGPHLPVAAEPAREEAALVLLSLLQREGRLVDFVEQDIDGFADDEIGAAARVLHAGCRKALRHHATIEPVRPEEEESRVVIAEGVESGAVKLVGAVGGKPPYRGTLRHRGWRVTLSLPEPTTGHDATVVAPAEVEL